MEVEFGTHLDGFMLGIRTVLLEFAQEERHHQIPKEQFQTFTPVDFVIAINIKLEDPEFEGARRVKLMNSKAKDMAYEAILDGYKMNQEGLRKHLNMMLEQIER